MLLTNNTEISESTLLRELTVKINTRFPGQSFRWCAEKYRQDPSLFAHRILGSKWWSRQEDIARALVNQRRVAVKSANGVGKTYLAADLALWFLYTHQPSIVLTTAPTKKQVETVLWEEIKTRWQNAKVRLPGNLFNLKLRAGPKWYAIGIATNHPDRFQGFHHKNMLIIFDEASGIKDPIWIAAEGVAVGENNKILAIGNPLRTEGRFYQVFRDRSGWHKESISALQHPNLTGHGQYLPGCTTIATLEALLADWCEDITPPELGAGGPSSPSSDVDVGVDFDVGKGPPGIGPPIPTESPPATESPPGSAARGQPESVVRRPSIRPLQTSSSTKVDAINQTTSSARECSRYSRMRETNPSSPFAG